MVRLHDHDVTDTVFADHGCFFFGLPPFAPLRRAASALA
jgi:hypothetical protein